VAASLGAQSTWTVTDTGSRKRVVILVSKEGHCLYDLLARVATGELDVEVSAVIGNHPELGDITRAHGIPFHHVPFPVNDPEGKQAAFAQPCRRSSAPAPTTRPTAAA
jgi:formyltetrahydrofolate deformylase